MRRWMGIAALALALVARARGADVEWADPAPSAAGALLLDAAETVGRVVAVGDRGHVLVSADGRGWTQRPIPTRSMLTAVAAVGKRVWAVGHDAVILHSADGGETWTRQRFADGEPPLLDVWFGDRRHGLAVGGYGLALATDDGGTGWSRVTIDPEERHLNALAVAPDGSVYIAAEDGVVFRSRDRARTWDATPTSYGGSLFGALALRDGAVLAFGLRGHVLRSPDAGATWSQVDTGTDATLLGGVELADRTVVIVGLSGAVLVSRDGGRHFILQNRPERRGLAATLELGTGGILVLGEDGAQHIDPTTAGAGAP
jgi:photosystem II stability/assembly factor-like uncharacterized protein